MGYEEMAQDARGEYGTTEERERAARLEAERLAEVEQRRKQQEADRLEIARKAKYGDVHYVAKLTIERVNAFPEKPGQYGNDPVKGSRKVTMVEAFNLRAEELDDLKSRLEKRLDLVEDDEIIDPITKGNLRDV